MDEATRDVQELVDRAIDHLAEEFAGRAIPDGIEARVSELLEELLPADA